MKNLTNEQLALISAGVMAADGNSQGNIGGCVIFTTPLKPFPGDLGDWPIMPMPAPAPLFPIGG